MQLKLNKLQVITNVKVVILKSKKYVIILLVVQNYAKNIDSRI